MLSVSRTERVHDIEMGYEGVYAAQLFASRTLLCWTVLGPILAVAAAKP